MKKLVAMMLAIALVVGMGTAATAVAKKKTVKVDSTITASFTNGSLPYTPYSEDTFSGQVSAKKGCKKDREITISGISFSTTTTSSGAWSLAVGNAPAGTYVATVEKKVIKKGKKKKIVCKAASAAPITVP